MVVFAVFADSQSSDCLLRQACRNVVVKHRHELRIEKKFIALLSVLFDLFAAEDAIQEVA
jgi:hypothetical protein